MNKHTAVISCILGKAFNAVYPAPLPAKSFFFSNREDMSKEVESKGWKYIFLDLPLSDDYAVSSLQAKYVKFLQFLKEARFQWFSEFDDIVYVDHKFLLTAEHLEYLENTKQKAILLRKTPRLKTTVWDEVNDAMLQERYRRFMPETKAYIDAKLQEGCSDTVRICNTGLISFNHKNQEALAFADQIYSDLISIGTAECQIIWAMVSQQHGALIQTIDWEQIPIVWKAPRLAATEAGKGALQGHSAP